MILTDKHGVPFDKPERGEFQSGSAGSREFERAWYAYKDAISDCQNSAFDKAFIRYLRT